MNLQLTSAPVTVRELAGRSDCSETAVRNMLKKAPAGTVIKHDGKPARYSLAEPPADKPKKAKRVNLHPQSRINAKQAFLKEHQHKMVFEGGGVWALVTAKGKTVTEMTSAEFAAASTQDLKALIP